MGGPPAVMHIQQGSNHADGRFPCRGLAASRIMAYACASVAFILVNKAGIIGNIVFFAIAAAMMLGSPMACLMGFTCAVLALTANTAFVEKSIVFTFSRVLSVVFFAARFGTMSSFSFIRTPPYIAVTAFCLVAATCSIISGYFTHIALIKVLVFWVGSTGFFAFLAVIRERRIDTTEWFVSQAAAVVLASILSLILGVAQNFRENAASQGLYNLAFYHSQTTGPIFSLLIVYLVCVVLFAGHRRRWICIPLICFLGYGLLLTRSRTGAGTLFAGMLAVTMLAISWGGGRRFAIRLNYSRWLIVTAGIALALSAILYDVGTQGSLTAKVRSFVVKTQEEVEEVVVADIFSSRKALIERGWENFRRSPLVGIGFGVSKDERFRETATVLYAPIEKGFLPVALLEEVGLLGSGAFVIFVITMFTSLISDRNIPGIAMFTSLLVLNLGEAGIFALGGHAAYMWLFVLGGILLGDRCTTAVRWGTWRPGSPSFP